MSYIGNQPISAAFLTDTFSGNGSTVAFTMSVAPANTSSILVAVTGVVQDPSTYSVSGTTLTFSAAPPSGTSNISVRYLGIPASGVTTTAYRTVTDTTATAGQTTFTIPSYTVGYVDVYRNGLLLAAADYTATTGTTVVLASAASAGDTITTESFYVSSVLNAIQQYNGLSVNQILTTPTANTLTSASGSNLQLQTNGGTTALTLDTAQNAGLGVTPSAWYSSYKALQIKTSALAAWGNNEVYLMSNAYGDTSSTYRYLATGSKATSYIQYEGTHIWNTAGTGTAGNAITFTQAMTLDASGNLGVGTTSPDSIITFAGNITSKANDNYGIGTNGGNNHFNVFATGASGAVRFWTGGSSATSAGGGGTERARIDSSGNLLVGTTSTVSSERLHIASSTGTFSQRVYNSDASTPFGIYVRYTNASPSTTSSEFFRGDTNTQTRFQAMSNGGIANFSANNINLSDRREKTNFAPAGNYLEKICAIPVQTFNFIDQDIETDGGLTLGVVAQDVQAVAPELVMESNWAASGEEPKMRLSIYQTDLQYALMKCIQEQQAIITQLQADVAALKGQA